MRQAPSHRSGEAQRAHASLWLALATVSVLMSGLFAILIALARVPALGTLFPGGEFYRVALTLHVNLSQGVWFMAFAATLWSLSPARAPRFADGACLAAATAGAAMIALSVAIGTPAPLMSNYLPVLDSPTFLSGLVTFAAAIACKASRSLIPLPRWIGHDPANARRLGLWFAAAGFVACILLAARAHWAVAERFESHAYFELLFWGAGHAWQGVLVLLMMVCWLDLAPSRSAQLPSAFVSTTFTLGAVPIVAALVIGFALPPDSDGYRNAFTRLMQWTLWPAPVLLATALLRRPRAPSHPGLLLSMVLFAMGLLIGTQIDGQTTLVTAHYHGTIGAVTLAFMALAPVVLPRLGADAVPHRLARLQLGLYGYGIMLMTLGLAGAGLMGAPRKTPGELGLSWSIESVSRMMLGVGGLFATIGILMFAYLVLRHLWPSVAPRLFQDDPAH